MLSIFWNVLNWVYNSGAQSLWKWKKRKQNGCQTFAYWIHFFANSPVEPGKYMQQIYDWITMYWQLYCIMFNLDHRCVWLLILLRCENHIKQGLSNKGVYHSFQFKMWSWHIVFNTVYRKYIEMYLHNSHCQFLFLAHHWNLFALFEVQSENDAVEFSETIA